MAGVRIEWEPDWLEQLRAAEAGMLETDFGPAILADMQAGTPVLTGRLVASEDFQVVDGEDGPELQIGSFPDDEGPVEYAAAVELGYHEMEFVETYVNHDFMGSGEARIIPAHWRQGNVPEQPYMRPALWRER